MAAENKIFQDSEEGQRPQFGNRILADRSKVFEHNAWDNVEWDDEQQEAALKTIRENTSNPLSNELQEKYESEADQYWDAFYMQHHNRFFKDRHWLFTEFPELSPTKIGGSSCQNNCDNDSEHEVNTAVTDSSHEYPGFSADRRILEVGCGVGNTVFPILETNNDPGLFVYCCDFSSVAIDIVKAHSGYQNGRCHGFVCDITQDKHFPFPYESLDVIILIFVLSAVHPGKLQDTIKRLVKYLKPGGQILFRDYGRYDMAQLRFKKGKCLGDNFYVRGDGTRCYFFTEDEVKALFTGEGLIEEQIYVDRRLQVNRGRQLKMYRIWIQGKYKKTLMSDKNVSATEH